MYINVNGAECLYLLSSARISKSQTLNTVQWLLHTVYNNQTHVVYRWYTNIHWDYRPPFFPTTINTVKALKANLHVQRPTHKAHLV